MMKLLVFEPSREEREKLESSVRSHLDAIGIRHVEFLYFTPAEVFSQPLPEDARAAFFTVSSMYDAEAARKFGRIRKETPLVVISDSEEYGIDSWSWGTVFYLLRPFSEEELGKALGKCKVLGLV